MSYQRCLAVLCQFVIVGMVEVGSSALAQVVPDNTLPLGERSQVSSDSQLFQINGGAVRGNNLFHSFEQFSLSTGETAFFNNATNITNIITRVTGSSISNINGLIQANGAANLFLLNPNGIVFGQNARINIGGSFLASTANSIRFADGFLFSAVKEQSPLLTISLPTGLQLGSSPGGITNFSRVTNSSGEVVGLTVQPGASLTLVGGELTLAGGHLTALGGKVELGSIGANNTVGLIPTNSGWTLDYQAIGNFQDIRLTDAATIAVNGDGRGSIALNGNNIDIRSNSTLKAGIDAGFQFLGSQSGEIVLKANGVVSVDNGIIANEVRGIGNGGNIKIMGRSLFLTNGAQVLGNSREQGNASNVTINALNEVSFDGLGRNGRNTIEAVLSEKARGTGGKVTINAAKVSLTNGGNIVVHTNGQGNAGSVEVNATDTILIDGIDSGIGSQAFPAAAIGNAGTITLNAPRVTVSGGAIVPVHTFALGNAGNITINAKQVFLDGLGSDGESSGLGSAVFETGRGNGGQIVINTDSLSVTNSASVFVTSSGQGDAGSVTINATGAVVFDGVGSNGRSSNIFSTVEPRSAGIGREINITANSLTVKNGAVIGASTAEQGNGGSININVNTLQVLNGGQILTTSRGSGNAGDITVKAANSIILSGSDPSFTTRLARVGRPVVRNQGSASGLFADTDVNSTGRGGSINVITGRLLINNEAQVSASTLGQGNSGSLEISASNFLFLDNGTIAASSLSNQGGNIKLQVSGATILRNSSAISTRSGAEQSGGGDGGNITINTDVLISVENSNINANAFQGRGGNIQIETKGLFLSRDSDITASSQRGINGTVRINTPDVELSKGIVELPSGVVDSTQLIASSCIAQRETNQSSFVVTGSGGLPTLPEDLASSPFPTYELVPNPTAKEGDSPIAEVDGIYQLPTGELFLGRVCR